MTFARFAAAPVGLALALASASGCYDLTPVSARDAAAACPPDAAVYGCPSGSPDGTAGDAPLDAGLDEGS